MNQLIVLVATALLLAGCGAGSSITAAESRSLMPSDPELAKLYASSCRTCHTAPSSRAPMTGSARAWSVRLNKGMDRLVNNTANGYRAMPAKGLCPECSESDLRALISFMATPPIADAQDGT